MEPNTTPEPRFVDYLRPIISRWWLVLVAVVVATAGVYAYYVRKPNVYSASTLVYVTDPGSPLSGDQVSPATDRSVDDAAALFDSEQNAAVVARKIRYPGTPAQLLGQVTVASKTGEDFISISADSSSPQLAAAMVNGFAEQFARSLSETYTAQITDAINALKSEIAQRTRQPGGEVGRDALIATLQQLEIQRKVPPTVAKQVDPAAVPAVPSSPKPKRNAIYALIVSLVGSIALCYGLERFDRRLKTPEDIEEAFALPVLAVLPHTSDPAPIVDGGAVLGDDFREPFRSLRTNMELASVDAQPKIIVVTSAMPGEGKSTVVRNLALTLCESGKRVCVVDLDLRNPSLLKVFRVPAGAGFTDVLRGGAKREEAIVGIPISVPTIEDFVSPNGSHSRNGHNGDAEAAIRLAFVRSGPLPANQPAVLSSERTAELLNELRDRFDLVLIDSAPVLAVSDTVPLLRYADATLFVGRFSVTSRDTVKRLRDFLARVPDVNVLGVVANELPRMDASSYGYEYGQDPDRDNHGNGRSSISARLRLRSGDRGKQKQPA
jgi:Mrp family chromosome partitioning ATPase/capsular polysaccharide biosynthesis protein